MKNNKILEFTAWILGLVLSLFFLFFVPNERTGIVNAIIICTVMVYLLHLALWGLLQKKLDFHNLPALTLSVLFLLVQTVWAAVVAFVATSIPTKTGVLVNVLLVIIQVLAIVLALISKNHIESVSKRKKNHHVEL